jgi:hypothetical protein|uniref:Uncharacterized protein n=1 Tax=Siphoviridae sp. ct3b712 TaxID=2826283 RepID=A0A8S5M445_9CAUD|nr:MAG TPA: hypothetical protein [Siphoviridae sp. ct3b712]
MEALDTILFEEGTRVPLNPHTTSSQVSHRDTTVEKALEDEGLRITGLRKIVIWSGDTHETVQQKVDKFLAADRDSSVMYFAAGGEEDPGTYVPLVAYKVGESYRFTGYYPDNDAQGTPGFSPVNWYRVIIWLSNGRWAKTITPGKFLTTGEYQKFTAGEQREIKTNIDAGSKAIRINYGNATAAAAAIKQFNNDPQRTVILVNYKDIQCVATVSFTTPPFMVAYVPEGANMRKLLFKDGAWSESVIYHDTVRYNEQTLTEAQKAQARQNINALEDEAGVIDTEHIATAAVTTDKLADGAVTSTKLAKGARRPIILTPDTTEVDEETYQKLLSDNVDVVFKNSDDAINTLYDRNITDTLNFTFVSIVCSDNTAASDYAFQRADIFIDKTPPHSLHISESSFSLEDILGGSGYPNKSTLAPVLKEIDLTGTDADRKAKLDKFETDWKALTGASDLDGARFVGIYEYGDNNVDAIFIYDFENLAWAGIAPQTRGSETLTKAYINPDDGSLYVTPLFSHLEAITIKTGNTPDDKAANVAAIQTYVDNLAGVGVPLANGCCIPVTYKGVYAGNISLINGDWYGLLVKNTNNPADNINIKLSADGTITTSNSAQ